MSRWFVRRLRRVVGVVREGIGGVLEEGLVGTKWMGESAMEVQFMMERNSLTSTGKFLGYIVRVEPGT